MRRYFAYGSNLSTADFHRWCGEHGHPRASLSAGAPAFLPDHRAVFGYASRVREGGALDVRPSVGDAVPGAVYEVDDATLSALDEKEGVAGGIYERFPCTVLGGGELVEAFTYRVTAPRRVPFARPHPHYLELNQSGLRALGLPTDPILRAASGAPYTFPRQVFVYGTLMRGEERHAALEGSYQCVLPATTPGTLIHLGAWPGLRLMSPTVDVKGAGRASTVVRGECVRLREQTIVRTTAALDEIEDFFGYGPEAARRSMYHRAMVPVRVSSPGLGAAPEQATQWAWTYVHVEPDAPSLPIETGDWRDAPRRVRLPQAD